MSDFFKCQGVTKSKDYKSLNKSLKASIHIEKKKNVPQASIHNGKTKKQNCFKCRAKDNKFSDASN